MSLREAAQASPWEPGLCLRHPVFQGPAQDMRVSRVDFPCLDCSINSQFFGNLTTCNFQGNFSPRAFVLDH